MTNNQISIKAPAKINLALDVTGKRPDGYHELRMIMQTVSLYDRLDITWIPDNEVILEVEGNQTDLGQPEDNLIYKAAQLLKEHASIDGGFHIRLQKNIPVAAGMAGGSTDCAATLLGINQLMELGLSREELCELGVTLGADVPYCIWKGTALAQGIGDKLTRLENVPDINVLLVKPDIGVSTGFVYGNLSVPDLKEHPDVEGMITSIEQKDRQGIYNRLANVLETVTIPAYPVIQEIKDELLRQGADAVLMSGSGPTVFALFDDSKQAEMAREACEKMYPGYFCALCQTVSS